LESLDWRFQIIDFNEENNIVDAIPYVDNVKLPLPIKKSDFVKEFTQESTISEEPLSEAA